MKEGKIKSFDGTELYYYLFENEKPKFIVQVAHGMQEYSSSYFEMAEFLQKKGGIVFLFDERGHGKTCLNLNSLGQTNGDIFEQTVNDHLFISQKLKTDYPNLPLIFFGHSYGSFIAQSYVQKNPPIDKAIICGSCYMKTFEVKLGKILAGIIKKFRGENGKSGIVEKMSMGRFVKLYKNKSASWITSDKEMSDKFYADKYCGKSFPIGFYYYMFKNQLKLYDKENVKNIGKRKILLISGNEDVVGKNSKGVIKLELFYKKHDIDVTLKLYAGARHALTLEKNRKLVFEDILQFIKND